MIAEGSVLKHDGGGQKVEDDVQREVHLTRRTGRRDRRLRAAGYSRHRIPDLE